MGLPRRCKHCRCYIADQLVRCPRCNKAGPPVYQKPTKEERAAERATRDEDVPTIYAKHMQWQPSAMKLESHRRSLVECQKRLKLAETPAMRNAVRSEIRGLKKVLATTTNPKFRWMHEFFRTKHSSVPTFLSPKGHRYVLAGSDDDAQLIIINRKSAGIALTRLRRFEKSPLYRMQQAANKEDKAVKTRKKVKKERRARRRKQIATLS